MDRVVWPILFVAMGMFPAQAFGAEKCINNPIRLSYVWQGPDQIVYAANRDAPRALLRWKGTGWKCLAEFDGVLEFGLTTRSGVTWLIAWVDEARFLWRWMGPGHSIDKVDFPMEGFPERARPGIFSGFEDSRGRVWLTTAGDPRIFRLEEEGAREVYRIQPNQSRPLSGGASGSDAHWATLNAGELADGRVVFGSFSGLGNYHRVDGCLVEDGDTLAWIPLGGMEGIPEDARGWYLGTRGNSVYIYTGTSRNKYISLESRYAGSR